VRPANRFVSSAALALAGIAVLTGIWLTNGNSARQSETPQQSYYAGEWQSYLSAFVNDPIYIQIPLYIDARSHPDQFIQGAAAIGSDGQRIDHLVIRKEEQNGVFVHYTIQVTCHFEKPGTYQLDPSFLQLHTAQGRKALNLGNWTIDILPKSSNLPSVQLVGAFGGSQGIDIPPQYEYSFSIRNTGDKPITFEQLAFRAPYLKLRNSTYSCDGKQYASLNGPVEIAPGARFDFHAWLDHPAGGPGFIAFQPQMKFQADGKQYTVPVYSPAWYTLILDQANVATHAQPLT
jgi:hypothetical protein